MERVGAHVRRVTEGGGRPQGQGDIAAQSKEGAAHVKVDPKRHPIQIIRTLQRRYGAPLTLSFSRYTHTPKARTDQRESFRVRAQDVTPDWLLRELANLDRSQELALESRVSYDGHRRHIPMLDFSGRSREPLEAVLNALPSTYLEGMQLYFSGRSFHAYFPRLLTEREWIRFMGWALLCNDQGQDIVDQRWVGHRLIAGYASLRWSCSSKRHHDFPTRAPMGTQTNQRQCLEPVTCLESRGLRFLRITGKR